MNDEALPRNYRLPRPFTTHNSVLDHSLHAKRGDGRVLFSRFSLVALTLRVKHPKLSNLKSMMVFAMDNVSIFAGRGGQDFTIDLSSHIMLHRILKESHLQVAGQKLDVNTTGRGGKLEPIRINYMKIRASIWWVTTGSESCTINTIPYLDIRVSRRSRVLVEHPQGID
ncbi:hypothetical protein ACH5RR_032108 [Cinchona calisaya]|uniref:Uncharacterized protein n=1 Tax=Cinchona calisaya TaxID=153742 RepID=A0ABD2YJ46_9GENT